MKMALRSSRQIPRRMLKNDFTNRSKRFRITKVVNSHRSNAWKLWQIGEVLRWDEEELAEEKIIDLTNLFSFEVPANPTLLLEEEEDILGISRTYPKKQKDFDIGYGPN